MAPWLALFGLLAASATLAEAGSQQAAGRVAANPIRKVVAMLQAMQKKVTEEGEREKELYEKFQCYCTTGGGDLAQSISVADAKVPAVGSDIEASEEKLSQAKADLEQAQKDRTSAKEAMAEATALREKEAAAFASLKAEYDTNIAAISKAVASLEKGMSGSFLQTGVAQLLRHLATSKVEMLDADRQAIVAFLSQGSEYAPKSGEIAGILKELGDTMSKFLAEATATEGEALRTYEALIAAKTKEVQALTSAFEIKTQQIGELGVSIVQMKEDLSDTSAALADDKKVLAELEKSCSTKTAEWEERSKTRADELVALAETIKVLNDDDALELFKKALPSASASFAQLRVNAATLQARALSAVRGARHIANRSDRTPLDLLALTLMGKRSLAEGGFDKVIVMIDRWCRP